METAGRLQTSALTEHTEQASPSIVTPEVSVEALGAICLHITENRGAESSRTLAALLRALYLDGSMFSFSSLDSLGPVSRANAEILIRTRIWETIGIEVLEQAYELVRDFEFPAAAPGFVEGPIESPSEPPTLEEEAEEFMTGEDEIVTPPAAASRQAKGQRLALVTGPDSVAAPEPVAAPQPAAVVAQQSAHASKVSLGKKLLYAAVSLAAIGMVAFIFA